MGVNGCHLFQVIKVIKHVSAGLYVCELTSTCHMWCVVQTCVTGNNFILH